MSALVTNPDSFWARVLVGWYGIFQAAHLVFNGRYLLRPIALPFPPPPEGWSPQTVQLLNGMAISDLINAGLALVFVYGYFIDARWWMWLGTLTLTVSVYAASVFTYGTVAMGAWIDNLFGYLWSYILFIPVIVLFILVGVWTARSGSS